MTKSLFVLLLVCAGLLVGCASGPRPMPASLSALDRVALAEDVLLGAKATATLDVTSHGAHETHFTGTLEFTGSNALQLTADGTFDGAMVHLELESMRGDLNRMLSKGPSADSHHAEPAGKLNEAVALGLVRQGLLHNLAVLSMNKNVEGADTGVRSTILVKNATDVGKEEVDGEACHRVQWTLDVEGKDMGTTTACFSDATGLLLQRNATVHFETDMTVTEKFKWSVKK